MGFPPPENRVLPGGKDSAGLPRTLLFCGPCRLRSGTAEAEESSPIVSQHPLPTSSRLAEFEKLAFQTNSSPDSGVSEAGCETSNVLPPGALPTAGWRAAMVLATLAVTKVARSAERNNPFHPKAAPAGTEHSTQIISSVSQSLKWLLYSQSKASAIRFKSFSLKLLRDNLLVRFCLDVCRFSAKFVIV